MYNKIVVRCYTEEASKEIITTKDLFMAFLINEMSGNQSELAYKRALEEFNNAV